MTILEIMMNLFKLLNNMPTILRSRRTEQGIRFIIAGGMNTLITYVLYLFLIQTLSYKIAYCISYLCGFFISYIFNTCFVFRVKMTLKSLFTFPIVYIAQYILSVAGIIFIVDYLHVQKEIGPLIIVTITIPITFFISRIIFNR